MKEINFLSLNLQSVSFSSILLMKMYLVVFMLMSAQCLYAGSVNELFKNYQHAPGAEYVSMTPFAMWMGRLFMNKNDVDCKNKITQQMRSMKMLSLVQSSQEVKDSFSKEVSLLDHKNYQVQMQNYADGTQMQILSHKVSKLIKELVIIYSGGEDCMLVLFKGDFNEVDVKKLVDQVRKNTHSKY